MASKNTSRIAILGAGPAGLTLASLLSKNSIPYTLFDLRPSPSTTTSTPHPTSPLVPSGSLDLHAESGLLALQHCGLYAKFQSLKSECSEETILADKKGEVRWRDDGMDGERPEIARNALTDLLLSSIPEERIKWEHKLTHVARSNNSETTWTVHFSHQGIDISEDFDLIIGADGAWSKVRPLLTETKPHFSSINCITLTIPHITTKFPKLAEMIGTGTYSASGEKKALMVQRGFLDSARIYLMIQSPNPEDEAYLSTSGLSSLSPSALKEHLLNSSELFASWGEEIKELISAGCDSELEAGDEISAKPLYMLPPGFSWSHVPGATLVGDAAHLMTPFAGEGVNAAMLDALELAESIISAFKAGTSVDQAVEEYETKLFPRAKDIAEETWRNLQMIFADDAPDGFVKAMMSYGPPPKSE
jgi:2-polyprenyl-6-methoxyphenol hydroxylase-like FAD-dependent oxidoreductase